jgi:hypothetical protein
MVQTAIAQVIKTLGDVHQRLGLQLRFLGNLFDAFSQQSAL